MKYVQSIYKIKRRDLHLLKVFLICIGLQYTEDCSIRHITARLTIYALLCTSNLTFLKNYMYNAYKYAGTTLNNKLIIIGRPITIFVAIYLGDTYANFLNNLCNRSANSLFVMADLKIEVRNDLSFITFYFFPPQ